MQANGARSDATFEQITRQLSAIASRLEHIEAGRKALRKTRADHHGIAPQVSAMLSEHGSITVRDVVERLGVAQKMAYLAIRHVALERGGRLELEPHGKVLRLRLYHLSQPSVALQQH